MNDTRTDKPITVSFQVRPGDWPDLHRWLSSIARRRERSLRIREVLEAAVKGGSIRYCTHSDGIGNALASVQEADRHAVSLEASVAHPVHDNNDISQTAQADQERLTGMLGDF